MFFQVTYENAVLRIRDFASVSVSTPTLAVTGLSGSAGNSSARIISDVTYVRG